MSQKINKKPPNPLPSLLCGHKRNPRSAFFTFLSKSWMQSLGFSASWRNLGESGKVGGFFGPSFGPKELGDVHRGAAKSA